MTAAILPKFSTLNELLISGFGCYQNIFFSEKPDWSKIILLFNGAVTKKKLDLDEEAAIYQRWSWHESFKHPTFCIADPLTFGNDPIPLAWYQGSSSDIYLKQVIQTIKSAVQARISSTRFISFGSSGGGFAALLSAQLGLVDSAIAINPQTDILKFEVKSALTQFLTKREQLGLINMDANYSLVRTGFFDIKDNCSITYIQNMCDEDHYTAHMLPYVTAAFQSKKIQTINLHCFTNAEMGHNPPNLTMISKISPDFKSLLK